MATTSAKRQNFTTEIKGLTPHHVLPLALLKDEGSIFYKLQSNYSAPLKPRHPQVNSIEAYKDVIANLLIV